MNATTKESEMKMHPINKHVDNIDRIINLETKKIIKKVVFDYLVELQIWGNEAANIMEHYMDEVYWHCQLV